MKDITKAIERYKRLTTKSPLHNFAPDERRPFTYRCKVATVMRLRERNVDISKMIEVFLEKHARTGICSTCGNKLKKVKK